MRLELRDVRYVYAPGTPFEVEALRGVSLVVEPGEVLGIVGGTGSGKSTLVQHMNLLLTPTSGEVLVDGVDATTLKKSELRRRVGLVFQFPESALFAATVEEDVAFAPRQLALDEKEVRERVLESLRVLGAGELAARSPFALSGGEKRRAAIAGVLAMRPEILVLDEPTAGLDPATREDFLALILGLRNAGISVVLVSHDLDEVAEVADRVCALQEGRVLAVGTPAEVFYRDPSQAPATVRVASLLRESKPEIGAPVPFGETLDALRALRGA
ncbi:MAG: ATPase component of general energizing module of ECF transporters [uncultured Rubrobacteraceae bacterium]|uniref:ATPase component of general energizing module of ECF transporters n=1 Tax=uncultured Rubrobacteraceae bacterium TaxID=349277 RepID=A0A6J4RBN6_9ACTN|nr:MAG: ATPase component of general energizing module of ECF transporters [uncultured Rubrobacteraceae bacterium]